MHDPVEVLARNPAGFFLSKICQKHLYIVGETHTPASGILVITKALTRMDIFVVANQHCPGLNRPQINGVGKYCVVAASNKWQHWNTAY